LRDIEQFKICSLKHFLTGQAGNWSSNSVVGSQRERKRFKGIHRPPIVLSGIEGFDCGHSASR